MYVKGTAYDAALKEAQKTGIAETDPSYGVRGKDSANKTLLIANRVFGQTLSLSDVSVQGITVIGGKRSPVGAAAAMLKDLINAFVSR